MDKLYKPLFLQAVKQRMAETHPEFLLVRPARAATGGEVFAGSLLYCFPARDNHAVWLTWHPDGGVERRFFVRVGWSPAPTVLPVHGVHDERIYGLRGPTPDFAACSLALEQVLGNSAIGGFEIPTPWDRVYRLKPNAPRVEQQNAMQMAAAEAAALAPEERRAAINGVLDQVFAHLQSVVPTFVLHGHHGDA